MIWTAKHGGDVPPSPQIMPPVIWRLLYSRGVTSTEDIQKIFSPSLKDLRDPFSLSGMDIAVDRIIKAINEQEKIAVYADYDLDGSPGGVLMKTGLEALGAKEVILRQPRRLSEGYGVHKHIIDDFHEKSISLIITVDVGITDIEAVDHANKLGIDCIVTDHHLPKEKLPDALAIINPNSGVCNSKLGHLAGTGVAFYLLMALRSKMKHEGIQLKDFLDLFAIATITDMVPLVDENRVLVKHGLKTLQTTERPGLQALLQELDLYGKEILSSDIGFKIGPKLNALSRLEEDLFPADVMLSDSQTAKSVIQKVMDLNQKRKELQEKAYEDALEKISFQFSEGDDPGFVSSFSEDYHPGVVSVVANKLMEKFKVPVFVGAVRDNGVIIGSARSPKQEIDLQIVLGSAQKHLHKFGGHRMAAGFEVELNKVESFQEALHQYFVNSQSVSQSLASSFEYDVEISLEDLNQNFMRWYAGLEPFGTGFEEPLFMIRGLKLQSLKVLKHPHLKLSLSDGHRKIDGLWFSARQDHNLKDGQYLDVLARPAWNEWRGQKSLQLLITELRPG